MESWKTWIQIHCLNVFASVDTAYYVLYKVFRDSFLGDHTKLFESALRQSSPCQINVKLATLVGFGLNFGVVYIL